MVSLYLKFRQYRKDIERRAKREAVDNHMTMEELDEIFSLCDKIQDLAKAAQEHRENLLKGKIEDEYEKDCGKVSEGKAGRGGSKANPS